MRNVYVPRNIQHCSQYQSSYLIVIPIFRVYYANRLRLLTHVSKINCRIERSAFLNPNTYNSPIRRDELILEKQARQNNVHRVDFIENSRHMAAPNNSVQLT